MFFVHGSILNLTFVMHLYFIKTLRSQHRLNDYSPISYLIFLVELLDASLKLFYMLWYYVVNSL